jgi:hypothetical protein
MFTGSFGASSTKWSCYTRSFSYTKRMTKWSLSSYSSFRHPTSYPAKVRLAPQIQKLTTCVSMAVRNSCKAISHRWSLCKAVTKKSIDENPGTAQIRKTFDTKNKLLRFYQGSAGFALFGLRPQRSQWSHSDIHCIISLTRPKIQLL